MVNLTSHVSASDAAPDPAIGAGREALEKNSNTPWYDAQNDDVRRLNVSPPPQQKSQSTQPSSSSGSSMFDGKLFSYFMWGLMVVALAVLAWLMIRAFMLREQRLARRQAESLEITGTQADRVEQLPIPVRRPSGDLLSEARYHYEQGNFREAIVYLYSHELLELDKHQVIHLARGKTNRQYLREIMSRRRLRELLEQTMVTFEDAFFGQLEIGRQRFEACWNRLTDFNALLAGAAA